MTSAERAVIDAARAYEREFGGIVDALHPDEPTGAFVVSSALVRAVRALPRPLSEQLAELRVGAVVEVEFGVMRFQAKVLGNDTRLSRLRLQYNLVILEVDYNDIRRIISNPEADRG